jgi:hypothetical protein
MRKNITTLEAVLRIIFGFLMTFYLFLGGPFWSAIGLYFLLSGSLRFCFIKKLATG